MPSFANILSKIAKAGGVVLGIEKTAAPFLSLIPGVGPVVTAFDTIGSRVINAIAQVEAANPVGSGQLKSDAVVADFESGLEIAQAIAAAKGEQVVYDEATLRSGIQDLVSGFNKVASVKQGLHTVKISQIASSTPAPPVPPSASLPIAPK